MSKAARGSKAKQLVRAFGKLGAVALAAGIAIQAHAASVSLLNVSYDPTRELYADYNKAFEAHYRQVAGDTVNVKASHGGSGKQARTVLDGAPADVVTLGISADIDELAQAGLVSKDWQKRLPDNATPYTSTIVLLVRKGNPKQIKDWGDLVKPGISVVTPNPKTSAGARWNYLAAWLYALKQPGGNEQKAQEFVKALYKNVGVLDSGARGATTTFVERGIGDVLIAWENEALLSVKDLGPDKFDIVVPSSSILTEPPVAVVDKNVDKHGTRKVAEAYLQWLYSPQGQEIAAKHFYRPRSPEIAKKYEAQYPKLKLYTVDADLGGWTKTQAKHFADGGIFDQIYTKK
ncbi:sulfate ABC transporter substrate-binding protein [Pandoraea nosoerga]|uniref:Sulfate transporter subunit n=1 Tax=Pandoraea nosoerga TaxID=2508296 RepID=A0A5E4VGZ5_9BURK|nr:MULTISPECIES: sulfate ABC transporter substrate-binding protein [Pandoraea]MBN4665949.1 sulfate ABC transporter substrate-binding protein [Pandoraea nosoerga]MBN4676123.1 sulfate ABC transporter substrate-binding protein [Pandoraea nosoerga]MBN4681279.1 sulfate ABC transporter substrate-binding protein [Pandoraea nosoerga]MBN4747264.1 sulfate ABC transporter substrate-binding protein [Pandoraea nosoerga]VVE10844.1 sulfate transporter subunit [Pandoraea nosoerga]